MQVKQQRIRIENLFQKIFTLFLIVIFISCPLYIRAKEVQKKEMWTFALESGSECIMFTDEGIVDIQSWEKDSLRIEATKVGRGRTERKANQILENIQIDVQCNGSRFVLREEYVGKDNFNVLDLLEPSNWHEGSWTDKKVDYRVTVPYELILKLKHDEGDVSVENLKGSFSISIDEGHCQLKNIHYNDCRVEIDEGELVLSNFIGEKNSKLQLYCDEGLIQLDSITGYQSIVELDEGQIRIKQAQLDQFECMIDEGRIYTELALTPQGRYDLSSSEGDIEIRLLNDVPVRVALHSEEGRISSNMDLKIRRSDESEQVREPLGDSDEAALKAFTDEGDIQIFRNTGK